MTGEQVSNAIAVEWERIAVALGPELEEFEAKLLPLLRALENPLDEDALTNILLLIDAHPVVRSAVGIGLDRIAPGRTKGSGPAPLLETRHRYTKVPVFFGTSRQPNLATTPGYFGVGRGVSNSYGIAEVSIPDDHRMGKLEKPRWWRLEFRADPERHITVLNAHVIDRADFTNRARTAVLTAERKEVLVFIHGFNVTFEDALRRAAQVAYDLSFQGVPALYSWPSEGSIPGYMVDANNVVWAEPYFVEFLQILREELGADAVHTIAHSMGARLLSNTIARLSSNPGAARLRQVVLAAPDIDAGVFRQLAQAFPGKADRFTLYASSEDLALRAAKKLQRYPRAGESGLSLVIAPDVDSIDASSVKTDFLNHSYFGDSDSILGDLFYLLREGLAPASRARLRKKDLYGQIYWFLVP
jgi:esterase/lipase superfamily enzyme